MNALTTTTNNEGITMSDGGLMIAGPVLGAIAAGTISGETMIPVGAAIGVIVTVWQLSSRFTKLEDMTQRNSQDIHEVKQMLATRPCVGGHKCDKHDGVS